jgi:hypothetical protein
LSKLIEQSATIMCTHAGTVQPVATLSRVTMGGQTPLTKDDTYSVVGCPFVAGNTPMPCVEVQWLTATVRVTAEGKALLLDSSTGLCKAAGSVPQGSPNIVVNQQRVSAT